MGSYLSALSARIGASEAAMRLGDYDIGGGVMGWKPGLTYWVGARTETPSGGIPYRTDVYTTVSPIGGGSDDTSNLNTALTNAGNAATAANPKVVKLVQGTYSFSGLYGSGTSIRIPSYVTLRGAGAGKTILIRTDASNADQNAPNALAIIGSGSWADFGSSTNLTADAAKGDDHVVVASTAAFQVGDLVHLDELQDYSRVWAAAGEDGEAWFSRSYRASCQRLEITNIASNTITFSTKLHMSYRTAQTAQLTLVTRASVTRWAGVEDMTCKGGHGGDQGGNFNIINGMYCWIARVESEGSHGAGAGFAGSVRCEVRDSYIHHAFVNRNYSSEYLIQIDSGTADCLVENCIMWVGGKGTICRASGGGNVIGHNYVDDIFDLTSSQDGTTIDFIESQLSSCHMCWPHSELIEGNYAPNSDSDITHGNAYNIMHFRNQVCGEIRGLASWCYDGSWTHHGITWSNTQGPRAAVRVSAHDWSFSYLWNVIGQSGDPSGHMHGNGGWKYDNSDDLTWVATLWYADYWIGNGGGNHWNDPPDATVTASCLRDGNYDYGSGYLHYHALGNYGDTTGATFRTPPADVDVPNSLYLPSKPAFMGSRQWPWVTPEGGTKLYTLPAKARFDAGTPNDLGNGIPVIGYRM